MLNNNLNNNHGFSLMEMIVALSILIIAFVGLIQAFPFSQVMIKTAENSSKAAYLTQDKLEQLLSLDYDNIPIGVIEVKQRLSTDQTNYLYHFQRQTITEYVGDNLQTSANDTGMKKISVTIYYTNSIAKTEKSYNISTLISRR